MVTETNKGAKYKVMDHMFFTNSIVVEENLTYEEAIKLRDKLDTVDAYNWFTVEKQ